MYTALAWGFVVFTAFMVAGALWLAWLNGRAVSRRAPQQTSAENLVQDW